MEKESPADFHSRYIGLAMPGAASGVATGSLPNGGREGSIAWLEFSSLVDMEQEYVALATRSTARLGSGWVDPEDVGVPGAGDGIPPAAVAAAGAAGYGISTSERAVCVYMRVSGTTPGTEVDRFAGEAQRIVALAEGG